MLLGIWLRILITNSDKRYLQNKSVKVKRFINTLIILQIINQMGVENSNFNFVRLKLIYLTYYFNY